MTAEPEWVGAWFTRFLHGPATGTDDAGRRLVASEDGSDRCDAIDSDDPRIGCCLPPDHPLPHISTARELLDQSARVSIVPATPVVADARTARQAAASCCKEKP